jgi:3-oxoacyl-ACP reductase-like protein
MLFKLGKLHSCVRERVRKTGKVIDENGVVAEQHNEDADNADMANSAADATASNTKDNSKTYANKTVPPDRKINIQPRYF